MRGRPRRRTSSSRPRTASAIRLSAYLATWLTDVGSSDGRPIDQVISLRYPELRHPPSASRVLAEPHDARVLRSVGPFSATLTPQARVKERIRSVHPRGGPLSADAQRHEAVVQSRTVQQRMAIWQRLKSRSCIRRRRSATTGAMATATSFCSCSRLTPLKRADLLIRALATPTARAIGGHRRRRRRARAPRSARREIGVAGSRHVRRAVSDDQCSSTSRAAGPCAFRRSRKTTAS